MIKIQYATTNQDLARRDLILLTFNDKMLYFLFIYNNLQFHL